MDLAHIVLEIFQVEKGQSDDDVKNRLKNELTLLHLGIFCEKTIQCRDLKFWVCPIRNICHHIYFFQANLRGSGGELF